ncbi:MAG: TonB-dependent receptor [Saonia sp.]
MKKHRNAKSDSCIYGKFDLKMKLSTLFLFTSLFAMQANTSYSQRTKVTLDLNNVTIQQVIDQLESSSEFRFLYKIKDVDLKRIVSVNVKKKKVTKVLDLLFGNTRTAYHIIDRQIFLLERQNIAPPKALKKVVPQEQQLIISGTVTDENGAPLPGASVLAKGTTIGEVTSFEGNYSITVPEDVTILVFSYLGFTPQEVTIGEQTTINVSLSQSEAQLEEVIIIGYGQERRKDLVGAVSTVQADVIENQQVPTFEQALIGQVSGVQFRENGGPDAGPQITVRGVATFGNNNPLFVIDGFPLSTDAGGQADNFLLNSINPTDIESISILKDAASKAIYGSRAANGVILITTKKGKRNTKPVITFGNSVGIQSVPDYEAPDVLNAQELFQYQLEFYEDQVTAGFPLGGLQQNQQAFLLGLDDIGPDNNWWDLITRDALVTNYNVGVSGGSERSRYNLNMGYQDRDGTLLNTSFRRYTVNFNFDTSITDNLKLGLNIAPTRSIATGTGTNSDAGNFRVFSAPALAAWTDPTAPLFDEEGRLTAVTQGNLIFRSRNANPVTSLLERQEERRSDIIRMGTSLEWEFLPGLKAKTFGSIQSVDRRNTLFVPSRLPGNALLANPNGTQQASARATESNAFNWVFENTLNYSKRLGNDQKHNLNVLAGFTMEKRERTRTEAESTNLADEQVRIPSAGNSVDPSNFRGGVQINNNALITFLGRLNYSFDDRYFLTASMRRDGSSRFGEATRYGNFPAFGIAWRVSNESFFEPLKNIISELKFEGGYGISGNNNIGNYIAQGRISPFPPNRDYNFGGVSAPGIRVENLPNIATKWEETEETNLGVDLGLFGNRILISADYYDIRSIDFLFDQPLPATSGFGTIIANLGEIQNKGIELELTGKIIEKPDFSWTASVNYTANRNEVIDVPQEQGFFFPRESGISGINITEVREGQPIGVFRGLRVTGLFTQEEIDNPDVPKYPNAIVGSLKFDDVPTIDTDGDGVPDETDGVLNNQDAAIIGDANPDFIFGFSTTLNYKNFDFTLTADGAVGQQVLLGSNQYLGNQDDGQFNIEHRYLDRWRPGDDPTTKVIPGTGSQTSRQFFRRPNSLWVQDADYMWIRNITLGYTLRGNALGNVFTRARVYVSAQNPFLFTEYEFGSPTVNRAADNAAVRNVDNGAFPLSRTLSLGFDITF